MTGATLPTLTTAQRIGRVVSVFMIFIAIGPLVGTIVFLLMFALIGMGKADLAGFVWVGFFALIYGIPFGYMIGIWPAGLVGLIVGIRQAYFGPASLWFALGAALVVAAGFLLVTGGGFSRALTDQDAIPYYAVTMMVTCIASTLVCWAVVRSWHLGEPRGSAPT
jgi:hypothetical protein